LLGAKATDEQVTRCTLSIVGQCMFYHHAKAMITRLYKQDYESIDIESLAEHVTRFSLGALAEYRKQLEGKQS
jgi:glyoxylate carboligase